MTELFKDRVVPTPTPEPTPEAPKPLVSDELRGNEVKLTDPITEQEKTLEVWEGLNRKKFVNEYFDTHNTADDFMIKMPTGEIDKYVRSELERLGYEKTIDNYKKVLAEIEGEIGSENLEMLKRFQKITGYIRALNKLNQAKTLRQKYLITDTSV